jgi:TIR domain/YEATS family
MTIEIKQSARPHESRRGYWRWAIWLDGADAELDEIRQVTYQLHPTFKTPTRHSEARTRGFRLESGGWGEFMVHILIQKKDGETIRCQHWLSLRDEFAPERPSFVKRAQGFTGSNSVFLSYAAADSRLGESIKKSLEARGFSVSTGNDAPPGLPIAEAIEKQIAQSDVAVAIVSDTDSAWASYELKVAAKNQVPIVPIVFADRPPTSTNSVLASANPMVIKDSADITLAIDAIVDRVLSLS